MAGYARVATTVVFLALALAPAIARGQIAPRFEMPPTAGWYVTPSFSLTEEFDDNVFATSSNRKSDFITRATPGIRAGYQSPELTLEAGYSIDAELFVKESDQSGVNRKRAVLDFRYLPTPLLTLGLASWYVETTTPSELLTDTGIELGRVDSTELHFFPTASYRFTDLTTGKAAYSYTRTTLSGGPTNTTQRFYLNGEHRLTPADTLVAGYRLSVFESEGVDTVISHTPIVGVIHKFGERTTVTLQGGPRFRDGSLQPEVLAAVEQEFRLVKASLTYTRTEASIIGRTGPVEVEGVVAAAKFEPLKFLEVTVAPSWRRITEEGQTDINVYGVGVLASYRILSWLTAKGAYRFVHQESGPTNITHNVVSVGLEAVYPIRVR